MPTTTGGLRYPAGTDLVRAGATAIQHLAEDVDDALADKADNTDLTGLAPLQELTNIVSTGAGAYTVDLANGTIHRVVISANTTFTFPSASSPSSAARAGLSFTLTVVQDGTGGRTVTWPGSVRWPGGVAPTLTVTPNRADVFTFFTDGGGFWIGTHAVPDV